MGRESNDERPKSPQTPPRVNKLTAPIGTIVALAWPEVTAWIACGWVFKNLAGVNMVQLIKVR